MASSSSAPKLAKWIGIELVRSGNGAVPKVKATLVSLAMTKMHRRQYFLVSPVNLGKINRAKAHLNVFDVVESATRPVVPKPPMQL